MFAKVTSPPPFTINEVAALELTTSSRPTVPAVESIVTVPPATARSMFPATVPMSMLPVCAVTVAPTLKSMSPADVPKVMPPPLVTSAPMSMAPATFAESIVMELDWFVPPISPFISTPVTFVTFKAPVMSTVPLKIAWPAPPPSTVRSLSAVVAPILPSVTSPLALTVRLSAAPALSIVPPTVTVPVSDCNTSVCAPPSLRFTAVTFVQSMLPPVLLTVYAPLKFTASVVQLISPACVTSPFTSIGSAFTVSVAVPCVSVQFPLKITLPPAASALRTTLWFQPATAVNAPMVMSPDCTPLSPMVRVVPASRLSRSAWLSVNAPAPPARPMVAVGSSL